MANLGRNIQTAPPICIANKWLIVIALTLEMLFVISFVALIYFF